MVNVVGQLKPILGSIVVVAKPLSGSAFGKLLGLQGSEIQAALKTRRWERESRRGREDGGTG